MTIRTVFCCSLFLTIACSSPPQEDTDAVARVGETNISFKDLQHFKDGVPALLLSEKEGVEAFEEYLQTMVDMELMLLEAQSRRIDTDPGFVEQWESEREKKLFKEFVRIEIQDKIDLPQGEIKRQWDASKWSRLLKLARIRSATADEAARALRKLESGTPFEELSGEHLTHSQVGRHQGVLESYFGRGNIEDLDVSLAAAEAIFELAEGEISKPLKVSAGYDIYKIIDQRPAPASYYLVFSQGALVAAYGERRRELITELSREYNVELDPQGMATLVEQVVLGDDADIEAKTALVLGRYDGGLMRLADFLDLYPKVRRVATVSADSSGLDEFVRTYLVPEVLFPVVIKRRGLDQKPQVADWLQRKKRAMLVEALRTLDVSERVDQSEEALRRYYESHQSRFTEDREVTVLEILVATREEAEQLTARIRAGEDMPTLAAAHSIRENQQGEHNRFHMHSFERVSFGELLTEVLVAEKGALGGPVEITATPHRQGGFSIFKVVEKTDEQPKPYPEAVQQVRYWWIKSEESRLYGEPIDPLREKHAASVSIYKDRLATMYGASQS